MVGNVALPAGKHHWALLCAQEQHLCGDVLGEEPELVAPQHPAPARVQAGCRARASSSPEHPGKPALQRENHPNITAPERAAPQCAGIAANS